MEAIDPHDIVAALNVPYTKQGVWIWLASPNRNLGNERPIDLLAAGKQERVVREIERISPYGDERSAPALDLVPARGDEGVEKR